MITFSQYIALGTIAIYYFFYFIINNLSNIITTLIINTSPTNIVDILFDFIFLLLQYLILFLIQISKKVILYIILPILICVAYFTWIERKLIATIQRRKGPNVVGLGGLLQPLCDGLKLFIKEMIIPRNSDRFLYILAPILSFTLALVNWIFIPLNSNLVVVDLNASLLFLLASSSLGVYGIIFAGWSSNSKYSFLGTIRSIAQLISYELVMTFVILAVSLKTNSINLIYIVEYQKSTWNIFELFPLFIISLIVCLAETNRHPFDLAEAESELVSGFNVEYSGVGFVLFFLAEYLNMLLMSSIITILFLGGWYAPIDCLNFSNLFWFAIKICFFIFLFVFTRTALPRYRYDQLMELCWKYILPFSIGYFIFIAIIYYCFFIYGI